MSDQTTNTEIVNLADAAAPGVGQAIMGITSNEGNAFYSSLAGADFATKIRVAEAQSNAEPLSENLNKALELVHVIVQEVTLTDADDKTGEVKGTVQAPRITLLTKDGMSYSATSTGVFSSINQLLKTVGEPSTWEEAIPVHFVTAGVKPRQYMTMRFGAPVKK